MEESCRSKSLCCKSHQQNYQLDQGQLRRHYRRFSGLFLHLYRPYRSPRRSSVRAGCRQISRDSWNLWNRLLGDPQMFLRRCPSIAAENFF